MKAKSKARESKVSKFYNFFIHIIRILRNQIFEGFIIFEFQGHKGQKGCYRLSKVQLAKEQAKNFKIGLPTCIRVN